MAGEPRRAEGGSLGIDWQIAGFGVVIGALASLGALALSHPPLVTLLTGASLGAAIGGAAGFLLARPLKRDLREISLYAALLAHGQLDARLPGEGAGELRYLMRQLDAMAASLAEQVAAVRRLAAERQALAQQAEQLAVLEERQRLARELHDTVSQELFALAMMLGATRIILPETSPAAREQLGRAEEVARRAQASMRGLIRALRPVELGSRGLAAALESLLDEVGERQGVTTQLQVQLSDPLPASIEDALFRIAQEAVSNAVRHGQPTLIGVTLRRTGGDLTLAVADNGDGFDPAQITVHIGLGSMRERAAEIGGQLSIQSRPGAGCTVQLRLTGLAGPDREVTS
jgi:NarL family two-component system sensor histidine kinase LiaS